MKKFRFKLTLPFVTAGVIILFLVLAPFGHTLYLKGQNPYSAIRNKMQVLNQILTYINELYFEPVEMDELMEGAFDGILKTLDPHSIYIPSEHLSEIEEQFKGKFQGIGIEFDILHGYITVISPVADSPSERVGLLPGDQIIEINGEDAYGITKQEVFKKLRGKKGTSVDLTIRRLSREEPFQVTIIRDNIPIYSVRAAIMLDETTGYIWLTRFSAKATYEVERALTKLNSQNLERLIFDLRNNSGGYLEQAAEIANLFVTTHDTLVYTKGKRKDTEQVFIADPSKGRGDFPLIILVNRGSASASEIVAGAVQDLDRGLIIGETTFGKGLVQRQIPLSDGSAIRVTIARYYTPSGRLIQRPYENGREHDYYKELYDKNREAKIDSLKELRPKYATRAGRTVYGGGGITPDIYLPWESEIAAGTRQLITSNKRPLFNWASIYASEYREQLNDYHSFRSAWSLTETDFGNFLSYLHQEDIDFDSTTVSTDKEILLSNLKAEIAGAIWGKDEAIGIRLQYDNQVVEALKHFKEATDFVNLNP